MAGSSLREDVKETAKQLLHAASAYEEYLKKQTGRAYKLLKPLLFKGETVIAKFIVKTGGLPMGFVLEVEYDAGPDLYNTRTQFYSTASDYKFNIVNGKEIAGVDFEQMMDPLITLGQVRGWAPKEAFSVKAIKETVEELRAVLAESGLLEQRKQAKLGSGARFKALVRQLKKRKDIKSPEALAAWIGRKRWGAKRMARLAAAGRK